MKYYNIRICKRTKELINDFITLSNNQFNLSEALEKSISIISNIEMLRLISNENINLTSNESSSPLKLKISDENYEFINKIKHDYKLKNLNSALELIFCNSIKIIEKEKELDEVFEKIDDLKSLIYSKNLDNTKIEEVVNILNDAKERISSI